MSATGSTSTPELPETWDAAAHCRALLLSRRCCHCAERVTPKALLRADKCPSCGETIEWPGASEVDTLAEAIQTRWRRRRWIIYILVTLSTGLTGFLPVVPTIVAVAFMIYLRYSFLREPMRWFSPARRFIASMNLKLWLLTVSSITLVANTLASLIVFANVFLNAALCLGTTALFVEVALFYLQNRLRREASDGPALETWEWGIPALLSGTALVTAGAAVSALLMAWDLITRLFT